MFPVCYYLIAASMLPRVYPLRCFNYHRSNKYHHDKPPISNLRVPTAFKYKNHQIRHLHGALTLRQRSRDRARTQKQSLPFQPDHGISSQAWSLVLDSWKDLPTPWSGVPWSLAEFKKHAPEETGKLQCPWSNEVKSLQSKKMLERE